jgi:hypothetical protein
MGDGVSVNELLDDLSDRLRLLEAERDVLRTLYRYGQSIDSGDVADWVDCFTADGRFIARGRPDGYSGLDVSGREALEGFARNHSRRPVGFHMHVIAEPLISISDDCAEVDSYGFVFMEHDSAPALRLFGRYHDRLVRCADGNWRFQVREAIMDSQAVGMGQLSGRMANGQ